MSPFTTLAPLIPCSDGNKIPIFGLGTRLLRTQEEMTNLLRTAFDLGYRHIDTAIFYQNQKMIGEALRIIFSEGKIKREELFIVSKIFPFAETNTIEEINKTLTDLSITYLDLILVHWSFAPPKENNNKWIWNHKPIHVQWAQLEEAHALGLTKSLGVSNYNVQSLVDLLSYAKIKPVCNQVELHVFNQQPELVRFCKKAEILITAYSPLVRFNDIVQNNEVLKQIAAKYSATISQVLLQFLLQDNIIVIPRTSNLSRLHENFESQNLKLTPEDVELLRTLDQGKRMFNPGQMDFLQRVPAFS